MERNEKLLLCPYWFSSLLFDSFRRLIHLLSRLNTDITSQPERNSNISAALPRDKTFITIFVHLWFFLSYALHFLDFLLSFHLLLSSFFLLCVWDRRPPPPPPSQKSQNDSIRVYPRWLHKLFMWMQLRTLFQKGAWENIYWNLSDFSAKASTWAVSSYKLEYKHLP